MGLGKADSNASPVIAIHQAPNISSHLNGSSIISAYELVHAFIETIDGKLTTVPAVIIDVRQTLESRRKLASIAWFKSPITTAFTEDDLMDVYTQNSKTRRRHRTFCCDVLKVDCESGTVYVLESNRR